jgi:hypothetical protein
MAMSLPLRIEIAANYGAGRLGARNHEAGERSDIGHGGLLRAEKKAVEPQAGA